MDIDENRTVAAGSIYRAVDELLRARAGGTPSLGQLLAPAPQLVTADQWEARRTRFAAIETFFRVTLELFAASLAGDADPSIAELLLNDTPASYGRDHHRDLPPALLTAPLFFRTDEAPDGTIYEIQCPGSGWGEYELLRDLYRADGLHARLAGAFPPSLADAFVDEVRRLDLAARPVLHLLDNSSSPAGVRYFINRTRPHLRYYGWDAGVRSMDCGLVRSHSFIGLVAENFAARRLVAAADTGVPRFDLPPHIVFDQKVPFLLPFWAPTRDRYPDEVRAMLPFTQLVTPEGFDLPDGDHVGLADFARLPRGRRRCYVKYAGADVAWNWGSQAVTRLTKESAGGVLAALERAAAETAQGHPWVIQVEHGGAEPVEWIDPATGELTTAELNAKYSAFHGPSGLLGMSAWYRNEAKVHSQHDAVQRVCGVAPAA